MGCTQNSSKEYPQSARVCEDFKVNNFYNYSPKAMEQKLSSLGKASYRCVQLNKWVYAMGVQDFGQMHNLAKNFRQQLQGMFCFDLPRLVRVLSSTDGTKKLVFSAFSDTDDRHLFESVAIPQGKRLTLCVSSQVGCNMACKFCYTGKQKLKKRLSPAEIVGQYLVAREHVDQPITNIVFMGMGEPLDNVESVFAAIEQLTNPHGIGLARKKITVSTSGLADRIPFVTEAGVLLAVSLNATTNEQRTRIMPINKKWPIEVLLKAAHQHAKATRTRVTLEYVLLNGVNDSAQDAQRLVALCSKLPCKVNLIAFNPWPESDFARPASHAVTRFQKQLLQKNVFASVRKTCGADILAACGQLNPN